MRVVLEACCSARSADGQRAQGPQARWEGGRSCGLLCCLLPRAGLDFLRSACATPGTETQLKRDGV